MNDYFNKKVKKEKKQIEKLEINCPNCDEENTVKLSAEIKCKNCEEPLTKIKYGKLKKPFIGTLTAIIIGSVGGHQVVEYFDTDRYPMSIEHSILENCISSYDEPLRTSRIRKKKEVCICALEDTINEVSYSEYKDSNNMFIRVFELKAKDCI